MADLDFCLFSGAGTADVQALCARVQLVELGLAGIGAGGHGRGRSARASAGGGAGAVHSALRRGQAESALPAGLLQLCVECRGELCAAEPVRPADCRGDRQVEHGADLLLRLSAAGGGDSAAGRGGQAAARGALDQERRHPSAVLLRLGLGGDGGADGAAGAVEDAAAQWRDQSGQAGCVCGRAGADGLVFVSRDAAADTADFAGRGHGGGLTTCGGGLDPSTTLRAGCPGGRAHRAGW